jgi:hypothetical protein
MTSHMMQSTYYNQFVILNVVSCASGFNAFTHLTYIGQVLIPRLGLDTADCDRSVSAVSHIHFSVPCAELTNAWILSPVSHSMVLTATAILIVLETLADHVMWCHQLTAYICKPHTITPGREVAP